MADGTGRRAVDAGTALLGAAAAVVESGMYGGAPVSQRQLDLLRTARAEPDGRYLHTQARLLCAARMLALVRLERTEEALRAAEAVSALGALPQDQALPFDVGLALLAAHAEVHLSAGDTARALKYAAWMVDYTEGTRDRWRYRALALAALCHAGNGDHDRAQEALDEMAGIPDERGWDPDGGDYAGLAAEAILALTRFDADRSRAIAARAGRLARRNRQAAPLADLLRAQAHMLDGELYDAIALTTRLAQGIPHPGGSQRLRGHALNLQALSLVRDGEPLRAIGVLEGLESNAHHLVCHAGPRAVARLHLGGYRDVLSDTRACVRQRTRHNLWTIQLVLLCRAIAQARLGMTKAALRNAVEVFSLAGNVDLTQAFTLFPADDLARLFDLVEAELPDRVAHIARLRLLLGRARGFGDDPAFHGVPERAPENPVLSARSARTGLTPRETEVARRLPGGATLREIAAELFLAESTVRTHVKAIYRKLGASSRREAVVRLEQLGFFEV